MEFWNGWNPMTKWKIWHWRGHREFIHPYRMEDSMCVGGDMG